MGRLVAKLALLFGVAIVLPTAGIFISSPRSSRYIAAFTDKQARLVRTPSPRIIFVGGSNIAFGLDSRLIEESLRVRTVNMGLHASLGLRLMLESVKPFVRTGDIVIVVPEYGHFFGTGVDGSNSGILNELLAVDHSAVRYLTTKKQWQNVIVGFPMWFKDRMNTLFDDAVIAALRHAPDRVKSSVPRFTPSLQSVNPYMRTAFNDRGDVAIPIHSHVDLPFSPHVGPEVNRSALDAINAFGRGATARGAIALFAFPCYRQSFYERESVKIEDLMNEFVSQIEIPILNHPADVALPDSLFHDTPYHPNAEGKELLTRIMIRELRAWIERQQP